MLGQKGAKSPQDLVQSIVHETGEPILIARKFGHECINQKVCGETVLLVEDEGIIRNLLKETLECRGYSVLEARNGSDALLISERHCGPIDLLVTDVVMPRMSGHELVRRLIPGRPEMRVLYMSGYSRGCAESHLPEDADAEYMEKPFTTSFFLNRIEEVLKRPPEVSA